MLHEAHVADANPQAEGGRSSASTCVLSVHMTPGESSEAVAAFKFIVLLTRPQLVAVVGRGS